MQELPYTKEGNMALLEKLKQEAKVGGTTKHALCRLTLT